MAAALLAQLAAAAHKVIDLSDQKWTLDSPDNDKSVPGKVPSHAHVDLYDADVIKDPHVALGSFLLAAANAYGSISELNEYEQRWVSYCNWTYTSDIEGLYDKSQLRGITS